MKVCINGGHFVGVDPGALGGRTSEAEVTSTKAPTARPAVQDSAKAILKPLAFKRETACSA